jgi:DnaJ homolog subfamily C member 9
MKLRLVFMSLLPWILFFLQHPDKCPDDEEATAKFQALSIIHATLSDEEKRKLYDQTGEIDDTDETASQSEKEWCVCPAPCGQRAVQTAHSPCRCMRACIKSLCCVRYDYYRALFPKVTVEDIENFKSKYQGSDEERTDVLKGMNTACWLSMKGELFLDGAQLHDSVRGE